MHQHVYFAYLPVIDWVCLKMGLIFQHFADCCISSHLDCAFLGLCTVLKQLHANKFSQRADGISHPLTESERNESSTTSESVTLRPPLWAFGGEGWLHCGVLPFPYIYMYVFILYACFFSNMQHACLFQALALQMIAQWPFLLTTQTYGLGNFQAWFRFYLGLV